MNIREGSPYNCDISIDAKTRLLVEEMKDSTASIVSEMSFVEELNSLTFYYSDLAASPSRKPGHGAQREANL